MFQRPFLTNEEQLNSAICRRQFLSRHCVGFGSIALTSLLVRDGIQPATAAMENAKPLASLPSDKPSKAKSVIFLFMTGGPSQMETFDPKPQLNQLHGKPVPSSFGSVTTQQTTEKSLLLGCRRTFKKHGQAGLEISDLFPCLSTCVDELAIVRSCHGDSVVHAPAMYQMHTGRISMGHPSLGSWVLYGLGTESENLPAFVVMLDPAGALTGGPPCWGSGYLPPVYQGTRFQTGSVPVPNLQSSTGRSYQRQRKILDLLRQLNSTNTVLDQPILKARLSSYELAFRMQRHAPDAIDLSQESTETKQLYGCDRDATIDFGQRCLMARRLVERGVRFVQLYHGGGPGNMTWDAHGDIEENHQRMASEADKPIAGLLQDLKRRGLLEETLVVWGGEFGRTPMSQGKTGRDHNPFGFTVWLAGGGVRAGQAIGGTDEIGLRAVDRPYHVNDLHATILHQLGLDHWNLTYRHEGRDERLSDAEGRAIPEIVG